ncbi:MAG: ankyrin repeat domain-containing protein [Puniceicoccales bacterium]|jgi:ankyrin repeat protein|nr:ankyrin repeat domain-containing protein [Puniceicoccales bacterium]
MNKSYNIKNKFLKNIVLGSFLFGSFAGTSSQLQAAPIHSRAARGDVVGIQQLLSGGANPNQKDNLEQTPLHFASTPGVIDILYTWGADPNAANNFGDTPLHCKVRTLLATNLQGNEKKIQSLLSCIKQLLQIGADKKKINNAGYSPESIVEQAFQTNVFYDGNIRRDISSDARQACIEIRGLFSPLQAKSIYDAVADNDIEGVRRLLDAGVDPNKIHDRFGCAPLHIVQTPEMVELLCGRGANINGPDQWGNTPLLCALSFGSPNLKLIEKLLQKGARIDILNQRGQTPVSLVQQAIDKRIVSGGRPSDASISLNENEHKTYITVKQLLFSQNRTRSLHNVMLDDNIIEARQLLAAGVDPNGMDQFGGTPLQYATTQEMIELLCNAGAKINGPDQWGNTPLHSAVTINPDLELIRKLLQKGARIDIPNQQGETPLSKVRQAIQVGIVSGGRPHSPSNAIQEDAVRQTFIGVQDLFRSFYPSQCNI